MLIQNKNVDSRWISELLRLQAIKDKLFFVALLLAAVAVFVPLSPKMPWEGLDPSWIYGMNEASAQGMSFGRDIVFTFGPYASIYTKIYHPATDQLMLWGSLYIAISFAVAAHLNFRSTGWLLKIALLVILSSVIFLQDPLFFFYPLLVGVHIYHWTVFSDFKKDVGLAEIALKVTLFTPFGLLPLIKGSALIACAAILVLSIALLAKRGQLKLCLIIGATPLVSLVIFWTLSGQPLFGLADYFIGLAPITSGYTEAMAINGDPREYLLYMMAVIALVVFLLREAKGSVYEKSVLVLIFLCTFFLTFKAGFVRHDGHAIISGTMLLLGALLGGMLLTDRGSLTLLFTCLVVWIYIDAAHIKTSSHSFIANIKQTYNSSWVGLNQRIRDPEKLARNFKARVNELNDRGSIPKLNGSVDIYSYDQSYLIASGNKWNPRPILQSYSAYTLKLAELNKMHLLSKNRPDNIIFKIQPIDGRLPSLEDGASWPVLLSNYEPTSFYSGYLFLKKRNTSNQVYDEPRKIGGGVYSLGEQINLPNSDAPLFVKINIRKSLVGTIINTLFKPSQLAIKVTMSNGATRSYRIISGMSESGFIASPLVENTEELGLLFSGVNNLKNKKIKTIEIVATSLSLLWERAFEISFYKISFQSSPDFVKKMGFVTPRVENFKKIKILKQCDGNIDYANGTSPMPALIRTASLLDINGWLAASVDRAEIPDKVYLVLSNAEGKRYFIDTKRTQRPDVGTYFKKPALNSSGYAFKANVSNLVGQYHLGLAYLKDNEVFVCPQFNVPLEINQE